MITSIAIQAYFTRMQELFKAQGFDPSMKIIYDSENAQSEEWLSDALAEKRMQRKGTTAKDTVRSSPFTCLFWTRSSLEPIVRQRQRLLDDDGNGGIAGKSTVSASFKIACAFISNKAEAIEDLEEAFAAVFQNTYNMPLSLQYVYNTSVVKDKTINFTYIQNLGESDLVHFKEGNLFAYSWSATVYMNYVSEFSWAGVFPVSKVVVDLYSPKGFPISSLDSYGRAVIVPHTAVTGEVVEVPAEPFVASVMRNPNDYCMFSITPPYSGAPAEISSATYELIKSAAIAIGGEPYVRRTPQAVFIKMPLFLNHAEGFGHDEDVAAASKALSAAIKEALGEEYVISPLEG